MLVKKKNTNKTTKMIVDDMNYSFTKIIAQNDPILAITITNTGCRSQEELRFQLTNKFFNRLHKDYKETLNTLNYLFVIEYPEKLSQGNMIPDNLNVHTHIVLGTTLSKSIIIDYIKNTFKKLIDFDKDIYIEDITNRNDKHNYINYLTKQSMINNYFTNDSYNYKINL